MTTAAVVIPAHNEEHGLKRCLAALLAEAGPDEFEIVVVANGCTDGTADIARSFGVACVETPIASKANALALGDESVHGFPRIYLDADVVISTAAARAVARSLANGGYLAAAPRMTVDLGRTQRLAGLYLRVWAGLPVFDHGYVGSGCYALSAEGRGRFGRFPDVIGDDRFVNDLFSADEKLTIIDHDLVTMPPRTLRSILRRSLRVRAGSIALPASPAASGTRVHLLRLTKSPRELPGVAVFVAVQATVALSARIRRWAGRDGQWLRDETSRG